MFIFFKRIYLIGNPEFKILEVIHEIYVFWVEEQFCFYKIFTKMLRLEVRRKLSKKTQAEQAAEQAAEQEQLR